ncbi:ThuA domain-containing protein [Dactylosporangium cerinum]|uniref:ThuA domain-containing protein n=1 Tax=Dactylosporangium cerinum TaxID=1434730 RepID=A0ABV9VU30_9ACTN
MQWNRPALLAGLVAAATAAIGLVAVLPSAAQNPKDRQTGARELGSPDYGVCRGVDERCYHDWGNFDPSKGYKVLLFTRTAGPRHANLGPALGTGLNPVLAATSVVQNGVVALGQKNGFAVDWTEDLAQVSSPNQLFRYNAVIFFSTSRDTLDDAAQTALRQYIRGGGGFVGVHNAFGTEYNWPWYEGLLGGANYYDHGPAQPGTVRVVDRRDVSTAGLPQTWQLRDEWYNLVPAPTKVRVLATVDESTLAEGVEGSMGHPGHGDDHPVTWCQYYDGGRAWLTTLGHDGQIFGDGSAFPGAVQFQQMLVGGIRSAAGAAPFCR